MNPPVSSRDRAIPEMQGRGVVGEQVAYPFAALAQGRGRRSRSPTVSRSCRYARLASTLPRRATCRLRQPDRWLVLSYSGRAASRGGRLGPIGWLGCGLRHRSVMSCVSAGTVPLLGGVGVGGTDFVTALVERRRPRQVDVEPCGGLRFAFYGRFSTFGFQDPHTSRGWQRAVADELIEGFGRITVEFFDEGRSRRWAWPDRAAASALLAAAERPDREFDAVVVGEYERAFMVISSGSSLLVSMRWVCRCGCRRRAGRWSWTAWCIKR